MDTIDKRLSVRTIQRLLEKTEGKLAATKRRRDILYAGLPEDMKAHLSDTSRNPQAFTQSERVRQYIEACEEEFGYFAFRTALELMLGKDVPHKIARRFYDLELNSDVLT